MVRPVEMTVALVDTVPDPRLMHVRTLPADEPYPHWLVAAAVADCGGRTIDSTPPPTRDSSATDMAAHRATLRPPARESALIVFLLSVAGRRPRRDSGGSYTQDRCNRLNCPSPPKARQTSCRRLYQSASGYGRHRVHGVRIGRSNPASCDKGPSRAPVTVGLRWFHEGETSGHEKRTSRVRGVTLAAEPR
jgi:hypothetical protein